MVEWAVGKRWMGRFASGERASVPVVPVDPDDFSGAGCPAWDIVLAHILWNGHWGYCLHNGCQIDPVKWVGGGEGGTGLGMALFIFLKWMNDVTDGNICANRAPPTPHFARFTPLLLLFSRKGTYPKSYWGNEVDNKTLEQEMCSEADILLKMLKTMLFSVMCWEIWIVYWALLELNVFN